MHQTVGYFSQSLTQAETARCLSVRDNIHICALHLRRRRAQLKLYSLSCFSDAAGSDLDAPCDHEPHTRFRLHDESSPDKSSHYHRITNLVIP